MTRCQLLQGKSHLSIERQPARSLGCSFSLLVPEVRWEETCCRPEKVKITKDNCDGILRLPTPASCIITKAKMSICATAMTRSCRLQYYSGPSIPSCLSTHQLEWLAARPLYWPCSEIIRFHVLLDLQYHRELITSGTRRTCSQWPPALPMSQAHSSRTVPRSPSCHTTYVRPCLLIAHDSIRARHGRLCAAGQRGRPPCRANVVRVAWRGPT